VEKQGAGAINIYAAIITQKLVAPWFQLHDSTQVCANMPGCHPAGSHESQTRTSAHCKQPLPEEHVWMFCLRVVHDDSCRFRTRAETIQCFCVAGITGGDAIVTTLVSCVECVSTSSPWPPAGPDPLELGSAQLSCISTVPPQHLLHARHQARPQRPCIAVPDQRRCCRYAVVIQPCHVSCKPG
jgi:hypothetical protein